MSFTTAIFFRSLGERHPLNDLMAAEGVRADDYQDVLIKEGKLTYPLMVALERSDGLRDMLERSLSVEGEIVDPTVLTSAAEAMRETGALQQARGWARELIDEARAALQAVPLGPARVALESVAESIVTRSK